MRGYIDAMLKSGAVQLGTIHHQESEKAMFMLFVLYSAAFYFIHARKKAAAVPR